MWRRAPAAWSVIFVSTSVRAAVALAPEEHATSVGIIPRNEFGSKAGGDELGPGVTLAGTVAMQERFRGNGGQHGCR
jgi:hypothetical protein